MKLYGRSVNYSLFVCVLFMCKSSYEQTCTFKSLTLHAKANTRVTPVQKSISLLGPNGCFDECIRRADCYSFNHSEHKELYSNMGMRMQHTVCLMMRLKSFRPEVDKSWRVTERMSQIKKKYPINNFKTKMIS